MSTTKTRTESGAYIVRRDGIELGTLTRHPNGWLATPAPGVTGTTTAVVPDLANGQRHLSLGTPAPEVIADRMRRVEESIAHTRRSLVGETHARRKASLKADLIDLEERLSALTTEYGAALHEAHR